MYQHRFFQIGTDTRTSTLLNTLRIHLNSVQDSFKFNCFDDEWKAPVKFNQTDQIQTATIEKFVEQQIKKQKLLGQYPIVLCDYKFEDDLFSVYTPEYAIISTYYWTSLPNPDIRDHLIMSIVDMILNLYPFELVNHDPPVGCPTDYGAYGNLKMALNTCAFCEECARRITRAVRDGKLPLKDKASILKILDLIAKRKRCFIIMPFNQKFDEIYHSAIKKTLTENNWVCVRSDEILETREVMSIIEENIHRSDLIIADLTERNPNVFYELGYAHASGKNTVLITQSINDIPFDLRHHQCIDYKPSSEGLDKLSHALKTISK